MASSCTLSTQGAKRSARGCNGTRRGYNCTHCTRLATGLEKISGDNEIRRVRWQKMRKKRIPASQIHPFEGYGTNLYNQARVVCFLHIFLLETLLSLGVHNAMQEYLYCCTHIPMLTNKNLQMK